MKNIEGSAPVDQSTTIDDKPSTADGDVTTFSDDITEVVNAYGYKALTVSIVSMMKAGNNRFKIIKEHINSVSRKTGVPGSKAARAVFSFFRYTEKKLRRVGVQDGGEEAALMAEKLITRPIEPGSVGLVVTGRPEYNGEDGVKLPNHRMAYMRAQSKLGLRLTQDVLLFLKAIAQLPSDLLNDVEIPDDVELAGMESPSEPISHRNHLKQVFGLVSKALSKGIWVLFDIIKQDGTGRFHNISRTGHQGPAGIRGMHLATQVVDGVLKSWVRPVSVDDMCLFAWKLADEYGVDYREAQWVIDNYPQFVSEGGDLDAWMACHKFLQAQRTGETDWLFEGDMNLSLAFIKACVMGCETSMENVGALKGWQCPNTWNMVSRIALKTCFWMRAATLAVRKLIKGMGTPIGYGASPNTAGIAVLGLTGVFNSLEDLLIPTFDDGGKLLPTKDWDALPLEDVEPHCNPTVVDAMRKQWARDKSAKGLPFSTHSLIEYAKYAAMDTKSAMDEVLPCLKRFDAMVIPYFNSLAKAGEVRTVTDPLGFEAVIPDSKLTKDKKDTFQLTGNLDGRRLTCKFLRIIPNLKSLAPGPYIVFLIESTGLVLSWLKSGIVCKAVHDAKLVPLQDVRREASIHGVGIIDACEQFDVSMLPRTDKRGKPFIDFDSRKELLARARKEHNVWGLPSKAALRRKYPDLVASMTKDIVLYNDVK